MIVRNGGKEKSRVLHFHMGIFEDCVMSEKGV